MRNGFLLSLGGLLAAAGLAAAQMTYGYGNGGYGYGYGYGPSYPAVYAPWPAYAYAPAYPPAAPAPAAALPTASIVQVKQQTPGPDQIRLVPALPEGTPPFRPVEIVVRPETTPAPEASPAPTSMPGADLPDGDAAEVGPVHDGEGGDLHQGGCYSCNGCGCNCKLCVWSTLEYLNWQYRASPIGVPLVTQGSPTDLIPGALGQPGTRVISPSSVDLGNVNGMRLSVGGWLNSERRFGLEAEAFLMERTSNTFTAGSDATGNPVIAIPYRDVTTGMETVFVSSFPGLQTLQTRLVLNNRLWGAEGNGLWHLYDNNWFSVGACFGLRYLDLSEGLQFSEFDTIPGLGQSNLSSDNFQTRNQFVGGQLGGRAEVRWWRLYANLTAKVALGEMHSTLSIRGSSTNNLFGPVMTFPTGLFAEPTNSGFFTREAFAVLPETIAQVGIEPMRNLRVFAGYDFLYVNNVLRPGSEIDRVINPTQFFNGVLMGVPRPVPMFNRTDFWAHGITTGVEVRF
jgi:hypothetical protein